jgi:hypothetical protein
VTGVAKFRFAQAAFLAYPQISEKIFHFGPPVAAGQNLEVIFQPDNIGTFISKNSFSSKKIRVWIATLR